MPKNSKTEPEPKDSTHSRAELDAAFEIQFFESVFQRVPDLPQVLEILGGLYTRAGRIQDGFLMDMRLVRLKPDCPTAHYNLACSLALKGRRADALRTLRRALALGYNDIRWMQSDPDLKAMHRMPAFRNLLKKSNPVA